MNANAFGYLQAPPSRQQIKRITLRMHLPTSVVPSGVEEKYPKQEFTMYHNHPEALFLEIKKTTTTHTQKVRVQVQRVTM